MVTVFWDVWLCGVMDGDQQCAGACCLPPSLGSNFSETLVTLSITSQKPNFHTCCHKNLISHKCGKLGWIHNETGFT
jgi:hypothetical protein